jgi:glutamyl-tRNA synthetase
MGWSYDDHTEFFTMDNLVEKFNIDRLNPSPAAINFSKLDHFNGLHIRNLPVSDLAIRIKPSFEKAGYVVDDDKLLEITPLIQQRIVTLEDAPEMGGFFFEDEVSPDPEDLVGKKMTPAQSAVAARRAYQILEEEPEMTPEIAEEALRALADELDLSAGQLFGILRSAVTGRKVSPPLFQTMAVFGKETVLERIGNAVKILETMDQE